MSSSSETSDSHEPSSWVEVSIVSPGYASELYVVNRAYALVAQGVGALRTQLEPGRYKVRQRIGYCEQVHDLKVPESPEVLNLELPALAFPSPIPLVGTSFASRKTTRRPFSLGTGNFRFVLWTPADNGASLAAVQAEHLRSNMSRLRLESFDGESSMSFGGACIIEEGQGMLVFGADVAPGHYIVVQEHLDRRQMCLPILVLKDRTTMVFSLALGDEGSPVPVRLEHAAVAMLRDDELDLPYEQSLLRLEAARKAAGAGRQLCGWSHFPAHLASDHAQSENILLDLLDSQLGLRCARPRASGQDASIPESKSPNDWGDVTSKVDQLERLGSELGNANADVVALRSFTDATLTGKVEVLEGAPLLKRNWDQLLSVHEGNSLAADLMAFPFQTEPSQAWFLWSETPGERAASFEARRSGGAWADASDLLLSHPRLGGGASEDGGAAAGLKITSPLATRLETEQLILLGSILKGVPSPVPATTMTLDDVEARLAALMQDESFENWLDQAWPTFKEGGALIADDSMQRLVSGLRALSDPALLNLLGANAVIKQALAALRLPQSRVVQLVEELMAGMVDRLPDSEQAAVLEVLHDFDAGVTHVSDLSAADERTAR